MGSMSARADLSGQGVDPAPYDIESRPGPLVAAAIHAGHEVRPEIEAALRVDDDVRRREEDPFTDVWTRVAPNRVTVRVSRFEVDMNRPRDGAVYTTPESAWGIDVWGGTLDEGVRERSLATYDRFYRDVRRLLDEVVTREGGVLVYDLHSYNHRRDGPGRPPAPQHLHPDVNVGTGNIDRASWAPVIEAFITSMRQHRVLGTPLDVRENVCFRGGHLSRWVTRMFPRRSCVLAIEVKKVFMDEWTHQPIQEAMRDLERALRASVPDVLGAFSGALAERRVA
jgi:N-formylglutamate deformylase